MRDFSESDRVLAVASRPISENGLGLSLPETALELTKLKAAFTLLPESTEVLPQWEKLVIKQKVIGKQVHDAHLDAAMLVHNLTHLSTFNDRDFRRFTEITAINPQNLS